MKNTRLSVLALLVVALVLGLAPAASAADEPRLPDFVGGSTDAPGVEVRIERSTTGQTDGPFETAATTTTDASGRYRVTLAEGLYRATFNAQPNGSAESRLRGSATYRSDSWSGGEPYFSVRPDYRGGPWSQELETTYLPSRTGRLKGQITSICQDARPHGRSEVYAADDADPARAGSFAFYDATGYDVTGFEEPTKVLVRADGYMPSWVGGDDFASATPFTLPTTGATPTADTQGPDVTLEPAFEDGVTSTVRGTVVNRSYDGVSGLEVRLYRSVTDTPEGPWVLEATRTSGSGRGAGSFTAPVPQGLYRATVNEIPDGSPASRTYLPRAWRHWSAPKLQGTGVEDATNICVNRGTVELGAQTVEPAGGTFAGRVTDRRGEALSWVEVALYADDATDGDPIRTTRTDGFGRWEMPAISGAAKLRFTPGKTYVNGQQLVVHRTAWSGGASDADSAQTVSAERGSTTSVDVRLLDAPLVVQKNPTVPPRPLAGSRVTANPGYSTVSAATQRYQWQRYDGRRWTTISGATRRAYHPTASDVGHQLRVQVTHVPPRSYEGVAPVTVASRGSSTIVRTKAHVRASAKVKGSRSFDVSARITLGGTPRPTGTAYVQWIALRPKGDYLYPSGKTYERRVRYSRGALRTTLRTPRSGYWAYAVIVPGTKTVIEHYDDHYVRLR